MLFYKPTPYSSRSSAPSDQRVSPFAHRMDVSPSKGANGVPGQPPRHNYDIMHMTPKPATPPRYIRDNMVIDDIEGVRS